MPNFRFYNGLNIQRENIYKQLKPKLLSIIYNLMIKYIIVHCKHNGCYDYAYYEEEKNGRKKPIVTINPPKIFLFDDKAQAKEFFDEYINDVDVLDERCVLGHQIWLG